MADITILPDERVDELQLAGMHILQKQRGFRFGMDAVLLADFARIDAKATVADFGTGTGILPMLLYGRGKGCQFDAFECQNDMADMASRSVKMNQLEHVIRIHAMDVAAAADVIPPGTLDAVICNPPYGISGTTIPNPDDTRCVARHQREEGLMGWYRMAHRLLKGKGKFAMVYPAPQMLQAMKELEAAHLAPKRFRLIYPRADKPANLVLIEALKDARPMLHPEPPLIVYERDNQMTSELRRIYHIKQA